MPHVPSSPLTKLCQSQQIADLGILDDKVYPVGGPACNTCSQTQACTITQEAMLVCINNYGEATNNPIMACSTTLWQFPSKILCAVLDKTTGHLREMWHLLVNSKNEQLWGKSRKKEHGRLAQDIPGVNKGTDTIVFVRHEDIPHDHKCNIT
jgi:hypothetical protein